MPGVLHVGDSHVEGLRGSVGAIVAQMGRQYMARSIRGASTRAFAEQAPWADWLAGRPEAVWITLGTNDVQGFRRADFDRVLARAGYSQPIVWWTPPALKRTDLRTLPVAWFIAAQDAAPRGVWIVRSTDYTRSAELRADGVHPTPVGYKRWARGAAWESLFAERLMLAGRVPVNPAFLFALADAESNLEPGSINPRSGAAGLFQITRVALRDWNQDRRQARTARELLGPVFNTDVALHILSDAARALESVGVRTDLSDRRFVELLAQSYNAGPYAVQHVIRSLSPGVTARDVSMAARSLPVARLLPTNAPLRDPARLPYVITIADHYERLVAGRELEQHGPGPFPSAPATPAPASSRIVGPPGDESPRRTTGPLVAGLTLAFLAGLAAVVRPRKRTVEQLVVS